MCKELCHACGQPLPSEVRGGVYLPPRKVRIFDTIKKHPGITTEGVQANCYPFEMSLNAIRVHVCQINDILASTDVKIRIKGAPHRGYRITGAGK